MVKVNTIRFTRRLKTIRTLTHAGNEGSSSVTMPMDPGDELQRRTEKEDITA